MTIEEYYGRLLEIVKSVDIDLDTPDFALFTRETTKLIDRAKNGGISKEDCVNEIIAAIKLYFESTSNYILELTSPYYEQVMADFLEWGGYTAKSVSSAKVAYETMIKRMAVKNIASDMKKQARALIRASLRKNISIERAKELAESFGGRAKQYATQLARDTVMIQQRALAAAVEASEYLFIGSLVDDSRPACAYCVNVLRRVIKADELPSLIAETKRLRPKGVYKNLTPKSFLILSFGWNCRHIILPKN